ncbi:hypothetical protein [Vibrio agarivorans]|uniref:Uncharacterized protein n=1 Tax=Vibrio agarivorans TaxID=153622 RepID=A0ABT7XZV0_9VIBR|nr:hypothetical protein [Vibrio agarivorans]MDN2481308.1 hypothetical protein [Vibrio agarivorans]
MLIIRQHINLFYIFAIVTNIAVTLTIALFEGIHLSQALLVVTGYWIALFAVYFVLERGNTVIHTSDVIRAKQVQYFSYQCPNCMDKALIPTERSLLNKVIDNQCQLCLTQNRIVCVLK